MGCTALFLLLWFLAYAAAQQITLGERDSARKLCHEISQLHPAIVIWPTSLIYRVQQRTYWTLQQGNDLHPRCRLAPSTAEEVSLILRMIVRHRVPFAVRSGGHSSVTGASNINDTGVALDLALLSTVELSEDRSSVRIGPGARWADVYGELERYNLSAAGGRADVVGVGGFILGGGVSWFSNLKGWSCDSVEAFEVILASGDIVQVSSSSHVDLFWALKGGGNAYGIITSIVMRTIKHDGIFGGGITFEDGQEDKLFKELILVNHNTGPEATESGFASCALMPAWQDIRCSAYLMDVKGKEDFALLDGIKKIKQKGNELRRMSMSDAAADLAADARVKFRQSKFTVTVHSDLQVLQKVFQLFRNAARTWNLKDQDRIAMTFQPFSTHHISRRDNALGFRDIEQPLIMFSFEVRWSSDHEDEYFECATKSLYDQTMTLAKNLGMLHPFVYANYAAVYQNPFASYGTHSHDKLKAIRDRYDSLRVFSDLQPGGLKLEGPSAIPP